MRARLAVAEAYLAPAAVACLGVGVVLALAAIERESLPLGVVGGGLAGIALVAALAAGWIDALAVVAVTLPLPAIYADGDVRLTLAAPVTAAALFAWIIRHGPTPLPLRLGGLPRWALATLMGAYAFAALVADERGAALREVVNLAVLLGFLVAATDLLHGDETAAERLVTLLVVLGALCGALAILEAIGVIPGRFPRWNTPYSRAALGFGQPNSLGFFLAPLVPLAVHRWSTAQSIPGRLSALGALAALLLGLAATFSRGSWLAVLGGLLPLWFAGERRWAGRVAVGALISVVLVDLVSGGMMRDTVARTVDDWVIEQRAALMLAGALMFLAHPLLGVGPGGFASQLERFGAQLPQLWDYLPTPHNALVQVAAETGIVGLLAFLWLLGAGLLYAMRTTRAAARGLDVPPDRRSLRRCCLWSLGIVCAMGFSDWVFSHGPGQIAMLVVALSLAEAASKERSP